VKGEHAEGRPVESPIVRRALELTGGGRTRHRPRLGAMSTSLLNELMTDHLDAGYAAAAERKAERVAAGEAAPAARAATALLAVGLLLVGLLLAVAYRGTLRTAPESQRARQALVHDVETGSALSDALQRQAEALSAQLVRERDSVLTRTETGERANTEVRRLETAAAQVAVTGPGIGVIAGDALAKQQIDPSTGEAVTVPPDDSGRLRDRDLQSLVNALWAAGAEAISVDGERLAPTTTIRAAGGAILVDLRPVTSPYEIRAIGDPDTLLPRFADSDAARRYQSYTGIYGIRFTVTREKALTLHAGTGPELRYAEPVPSTSASPAGGGS
jgi:uncharacterized protein YlxW (UPF0749 family)